MVLLLEGHTAAAPAPAPLWEHTLIRRCRASPLLSSSCRCTSSGTMDSGATLTSAVRRSSGHAAPALPLHSDLGSRPPGSPGATVGWVFVANAAAEAEAEVEVEAGVAASGRLSCPGAEPARFLLDPACGER